MSPRSPLVFWLSETLVGVINFLLADVALDIDQVFGLILIFLCHFGNVNLSSWITSFSAFLVALVSLTDLGLSLSLRLICINRKSSVIKFSFVVLMVPTGSIFLGEFMTLWIFSVNFSQS